MTMTISLQTSKRPKSFFIFSLAKFFSKIAVLESRSDKKKRLGKLKIWSISKYRGFLNPNYFSQKIHAFMKKIAFLRNNIEISWYYYYRESPKLFLVFLSFSPTFSTGSFTILSNLASLRDSRRGCVEDNKLKTIQRPPFAHNTNMLSALKRDIAESPLRRARGKLFHN